jgi:hypothetical protein
MRIKAKVTSGIAETRITGELGTLLGFRLISDPTQHPESSKFEVETDVNANSSVSSLATLSWPAVSLAQGYHVYGRTDVQVFRGSMVSLGHIERDSLTLAQEVCSGN